MSHHHRIALLAIAAVAAPVALAHAQDRKAEAPERREERPRPVMRAMPQAPRAALWARCNDGTRWSGAERPGACTNHGGVKAWLNAREERHEDHNWDNGVTARCNDGTTWTNVTRPGACASHGGVKKWRVDDDDDQDRPREAKARCNDGNWWSAATRQGACAGHGGVHHWLPRHAVGPDRH